MVWVAQGACRQRGAREDEDNVQLSHPAAHVTDQSPSKRGAPVCWRFCSIAEDQKALELRDQEPEWWAEGLKKEVEASYHQEVCNDRTPKISEDSGLIFHEHRANFIAWNRLGIADIPRSAASAGKPLELLVCPGI